MKRSFNKKSKDSTKNRGVQRKRTPAFKTERAVFKPKIERTDIFKDDDDMRLNKYVALCGIASRRGAADLIKEGLVTINGEVTLEIGQRITPKDVISYKGKVIKPIEQLLYILMNKPKDTITTVSDERGRKTVIDIINRTIKARIYPVGRLDRDTTGLLLLTNDGDLAQKMSHPSYKIKKIYQVSLDKALNKDDLALIANGVALEDGIAEVDAVNYVEGSAKTEVLIEIHIGKNRIVRRIFEQLGYNVMKLDRVYYGGLTKKDLPRGTYRQLTEREVIMLKHFNGK
jgi:23S rRNA pseudouridine2605 synthase